MYAKPCTNDCDEKRIIRRCQKGDLHDFGRIVSRYQRQVVGLACKYLKDGEDAMDMAQEVFLQGMLKINRFDLDRSFKTWISTITVHRSIDHLRRRRLFMKYFENEGGLLLEQCRRAARADKPARRVAESELFAPFLKRLTRRQRQTLLLYMDQGLSTREIAERFNCTSSTVRGYLFNARKILRRCLEEADFIVDAPSAAVYLDEQDLSATLAS